MSFRLSKKEIADRIQPLCVLVVDDNQYMRKMIRNLLLNCGVKDIFEAGDGITALDTIRTLGPDVPIIMLSGHGERWRVLEAVQLGVNEYLVKPVSAKALYDRLVTITIQPRPAVQLGDYHGPEPRKLAGEAVEDVNPALPPAETVAI
jgi:two-component system, chemotaxis family, chemotaxis protein CheY